MANGRGIFYNYRRIAGARIVTIGGFHFLARVKVLMLHQHFNTPERGGPLRSYYLARACADRGWHPIVITTHNAPRYQTEVREGIEVHYLPVSYENHYGFYRRTVAFVKFLFGCLYRARRFRDASLCYAISVPLTVGVAAMFIRALYGIPFIFEVGDLWPEVPVRLGFIRNPLLKRFLYTVERTIYSRASVIVALSEPIRAHIAEKVNSTRIEVVENMSDVGFFSPEPKRPDLERNFAVAGKFVISYIGTLGYANGLDHFIDCAAAAKSAGLPVHFLLCGKGAMERSLKDRARALQLDNLTFIPFRNRPGVREVFNVTDAAFISYRSSPILETGSPNKYFDALAAGKLVIVNFGGWIWQEVSEHACGLRVAHDNPDDFVRQIAMFVSDRVRLSSYERNARQLAEKRYARALLSWKLVELIARTANTQSVR